MEIIISNASFEVFMLEKQNLMLYEIKHFDGPELDRTDLVNRIKELVYLPGLISSELKKQEKELEPEQLLLNLELKEDEKGRVILSIIDPDKEGADIIKLCQKQLRAKSALGSQKEKNEALVQAKKEGEVITYNNTSEIKATTTKMLYDFYSLAPSYKVIDGQWMMNFDYASDGRIIPLAASCKFVEGTSEEDKKLMNSSYACFVGLVLNNLFLEGNKRISPSKILQEMGIPGSRPNINKLMKVLEIGMGGIMEVDNREVLKGWGRSVKNYQNIKTHIYPIAIKNEISMARGHITDTIIEIRGLSPFYLVGEPLNQITNWDKRLLKLYKHNRTERYFRVMLYLMQQIAWATNDPTRPRVFTLDHIYASCGANSRSTKEDTKKVLWELLTDVFQPLDYIHDVTEDPSTGSIRFKIHKNRKPNEAAIEKTISEKLEH